MAMMNIQYSYSIQYVLNILTGIMNAFQYQKVWYFCY